MYIHWVMMALDAQPLGRRVDKDFLKWIIKLRTIVGDFRLYFDVSQYLLFAVFLKMIHRIEKI